MTLKDKILSIVNNKRNVNGLTTAEVHAKLVKSYVFAATPYSSTRGRLYELSDAGEIYRTNRWSDTPSKFKPVVAQAIMA